ncbi:HD domain-containing protein [Vibrio pectenicida]|uniref:HD domain-containing protein n=1 Tax=Vibrio pectenicida TaxID=62763 RepID=A0A7Y3ZYQ3_9VIBR|nr:HD domain-containing phosphohydrolase [Vibrio pectenicida]NOH71582.1 HD domain-containing protein [Vibrio pectenicida]
MDALLDNVSIDLRKLLFEIATALDAVGVDDIQHGYRVAYMAYQCSKRMGWEEELTQVSFALGLIHDCGVSKPKERASLFATLQPDNVQAHCNKGYQLLRVCPPLAELALPILYHHTEWSILSNESQPSSTDKKLASLIFICDRVDFLYLGSTLDQFGHLTSSDKNLIVNELMESSGSLFEPGLVACMSELIHCDDFWFSMQPEYIETMASRFPSVPFFAARMGLENSISVAELFAEIVDTKSPFTCQHSRKVARLSAFIGKKLGFSAKAQRMLYLAGLVHDIGKLKTPSVVLHKPTDLTKQEYACIKRHATDTRHTLMNIFQSSQIVEWAANHHERLDGSGYPLGKSANDIDLPSRIIAIGDVFQALTQSRPYRQGLTINEALQIIRALVEDGKLDQLVFDCLQENSQECYFISTAEQATASA